jgi:RNA polymerase sigma factor for flagellar operon FliA
MKNNTAALRINDNGSRNEAIEKSLPLVKSIAARFRQAHGLSASFDELYALGVDGLMQAATRFDPNRGVAFTTFAYYRIRGAILDSLRREPDGARLTAVSMPIETSLPLLGVAAANDNGRPQDRPTGRQGTLGWLFAEAAVSQPVEDIDELADEDAPSLDEEVERHRVAQRVAAALATLPETERRVVELHYYDELSFAEIGAKLGICKPWAFRLHNKALKHLKEKLAELAEADGALGNA